jgi:hypothetical protein
MTSVRRNLKWDVVAPPVAFPNTTNESDHTARRLFSTVTSEATPFSSSSSSSSSSSLARVALQHNTSLDNNNIENTSAIHQNSGSSGSDDSLVAPSFQPLVLRRLDGGGSNTRVGGGGGDGRKREEVNDEGVSYESSSYPNFTKNSMIYSRLPTSGGGNTTTTTKTRSEKVASSSATTDNENEEERQLRLLASSAVARALLLPNSPPSQSSFQRQQKLDLRSHHTASASVSSLMSSSIDASNKKDIVNPIAAVSKAMLPSPTPEAIAAAADWRKVTTSDGKVYFYNRQNRVSVWALPTGIDASLVKATTAASTTTKAIVAAPAPAPVSTAVVAASIINNSTTTGACVSTLNLLSQPSKQSFQSPSGKRMATTTTSTLTGPVSTSSALINEQPLSPLSPLSHP